ncbi:MAG: ABC transporter permease, partial [Planctomycetes bacterium]|nr:ABC transporter permease [Planctomycetota bacterium]
GAPGGDAQVQSMLQVFLNVFHFGMDVQEAIDAPRMTSHSFPSSFSPFGHYPAVVSLEVVVYLSIGLAVGVNIEAGIGGVFVLAFLVVPFAVGIGGISTFVALRTGSAEAVQGTFPLMFALMFLSSLTIPRDLMEVDWFRTVATINPISYFIESVRSLIITGWDEEALARGFLVVAGTLAAGLTAATLALRGRVERT